MNRLVVFFLLTPVLYGCKKECEQETLTLINLTRFRVSLTLNYSEQVSVEPYERKTIPAEKGELAYEALYSSEVEAGYIHLNRTTTIEPCINNTLYLSNI